MKTRLAILLIVFTTLLQAESLENRNYGSVTVSEVTSIQSGDNFTVNIKGYPDIIGDKIDVTVKNIDTPSMKAKCQIEKELASKAKQYTAGRLKKAQMIELHNMKRAKDFRILADVFIDNKSLADGLIEANLSVAYNDKTEKKNWCVSEKTTLASPMLNSQELSVTVIPNNQRYLIDNKEVLEKTILSQLKEVVKSKAVNKKLSAVNKVEFTLQGKSIRWLSLKDSSGKDVLDDISLEAIRLSYHKFPSVEKMIVVQVEFTYSLY